MNKTGIDWVKNPDGTKGYSFNPITGCLNHVNGMCKGGNFPCWAYGLANTRLKERYLANANVSLEGEYTKQHPDLLSRLKDPFYPRFWPERMRDINPYLHQHPQKPRGVFPCDMSDLFGIGIPENWTREILGGIAEMYEWRFYLLTKQPQNLIKFSPFPDNCYVGVTATDDSMVTHAVVALDYIDAKVKYLSLEPLLNWDMSKIDLAWTLETYKIDWVIIGAQTKPTVMPKIEWVKAIVEACDKAGIPVFLKDSLKPLISSQCNMNDTWAAKEWVQCKYPVLRQEMPGEIR